MQPAVTVVTGTVEAGPIRPVSIVGQPSTRPLAGAVVEALRQGEVAAAAVTDDAGRYELELHPGSYLIRATATGLRSRQPGRMVTLSGGETLTVGFVLDTGIRCREGHQPAACPLGARCRWVKAGSCR